MEGSLKYTRDQLSQKEEENDMLMRTIRARAADEELYEKDKSQLLKQVSTMTSLMVEKDTKISTLKKRLGELRKMLQFRNAAKPPSSKQAHLRSQSVLVDKLPEDEELSMVSESQESTSNMELLTAEEISELKAEVRLLERASALECSSCGKLLCKKQFSSHIADCSEIGVSETAETEGEMQKREYRNIIRELRAEQKILRGEVDRLTYTLRQAKVDLAVQAEKSAEREHELKSQQKTLVNHILAKEPSWISELAPLLQPGKSTSRSLSLQSAC
mmetsp:Transcript_18410/g.33132  ORF Transcript_18410/g.33132 Transcript_18410/m.33132 type:complete len:274 (-) Transcript_18410:1587-2408(-)